MQTLNSDAHTILYVDDEPYLFEIIKMALKDFNSNFFFEADGKAAYDTAIKEKPDIIITDWELPELDGLELVKQLSIQEETKETPIIMCTGRMTSSENLKLALEAGAVDFIRKPLDLIELRARVHSSLILSKSYKENKKQLEIIHKQEKEILEKQNVELNEELDKNKNELSTQIFKLTHANELNVNMVNELLQTVENPGANFSKNILQVVARYKGLINESTWQEFHLRFEKVYSNFYKNLLAEHPDITPTELKFCAFFKQGLSSKEISLLSFTNYEAIRKSRHRLRKKLKLQAEDDLISYFQKF